LRHAGSDAIRIEAVFVTLLPQDSAENWMSYGLRQTTTQVMEHVEGRERLGSA